MKKVLATIAIALGISSFAHAGILIEPYLGYEMGDLKRAQPLSSEFTDKLSANGMGMRLGYKFLLPWVALDYTTFSGKAKNGDPALTDYDYTKSQLGAVAGVDLPLIRGWVGHGFSNNFTQKDAGGDVKYTGTYTKVGVGFGFIPFVSLNAEYIINTYEKIDIGGTELQVKNIFDTFDHKTLLFSISAPFNL